MDAKTIKIAQINEEQGEASLIRNAIKNIRKLGLVYYYHGALRLAVHAAFRRYIEPAWALSLPMT